MCSADYGLSIGRGAFRFAAGNWTRVRQTVTLNTPGAQDGGFALDVDGHRVIERCDVFYRGKPTASAKDDGGPMLFAEGGVGGADSVLAASPDAPVDFTPLFGPPSGPDPVPDPPAVEPSAPAAPQVVTVTSTTTVCVAPTTITVAASTTQTDFALATAAIAAPPLITALGLSAAAPAPAPIGFTGLFFRCVSGVLSRVLLVRLTDALARSTFFGGHEPKYATPRDQFTWFKDFAMTINA